MDRGASGWADQNTSSRRVGSTREVAENVGAPVLPIQEHEVVGGVLEVCVGTDRRQEMTVEPIIEVPVLQILPEGVELVRLVPPQEHFSCSERIEQIVQVRTSLWRCQCLCF